MAFPLMIRFILSLSSAVDLTVCRIILKHVDPVVEVNEGVTDDNNIHFASDEDSPGDQEPDKAKSIFSDLYHVSWHYTRRCGCPWIGKEQSSRPPFL